MRKIWSCTLAMITLSLSGNATSVDFSIKPKSWEKHTENLKVMSLSEISEQVLNEIMQGEHPDLAVQFSKGTQLPINFFLIGDLVNLTEDQINFGRIEIQQTFYARYAGGELILSVNLKKWKPLLEFITGNASVVLSIQNQEPSITFGAAANRRI
jgi:hypothetical protein